jgi:hypothetical protein
MVQSTSRINEKAPELMEQMTITASTETGEEDFVMWLHAKNVKPEPPTPVEPYSEFAPKVEEIKDEVLVEESAETQLETELHSRT